MKRHSSHRVYALVFVASSLAGAVGIAACVSDELPVGAGPDAGGLDSATPDTSTPVNDGAPPVEVPDAGEEVTDGGGLPPEEDEDGGTTDLDGGFDGGAACASLTAGAYVQSGCATLSKIHVGGELTSGVYVLTTVTALGSKAFCEPDGGYIAYDHRGVLEVTASTATTATFEFLDQYRKTGPIIARPSTLRYDVSVAASGKVLSYTPQACALKTAPPSAEFSVGKNAESKKTITLKLPYGKGTANFTFVQQ